MPRPWTGPVVAALTALALWSPHVGAKSAPQDAFLRAPTDRALPAAAASQVEQRGLEIRSTEGRLGVPTFLLNSQPRSSAQGPARALAPASADAAARAHLKSVAPLYRLDGLTIDAAELLNVHQPALGVSGPVVARFGRRVNGVEVFRNEVKVVMDASHELVAISGYLAPPTADETRAAQASAFRLSAPEAIAIATGALTGTRLDTRALQPSGRAGDYLFYSVDGALAPGLRFAAAPRAKRVLWAMPDTHVPAWYVEINAGPADATDAPYVAYVVSARDGAVLLRNELSADEAFTYRLWVDTDGIPHDGPQGTVGTPHPTGIPDGFQAPFVPSSLATRQNFPFSRNDPWLAADATKTIGNNVEAYADRGGGDGFQPDFDHHAVTTGPRTFDYAFDPTRDPTADQTQRNAAIVNLFYVTNFLHDWFYDVGFDELAGNAQASNYGRGGIEGDSLRVEAQDYGGRNNANMSTPADGARPRMQQYIFDGTPTFRVTAPVAIAGVRDAADAAFSPPSYDVSGNLALPPAHADPAVAAALRIGCADANGTSPFSGTPFAGQIAVIERGTCSFVYKVLNAQSAGAVAVVITNNTAGAAPSRMGASGLPVDALVHVPSMMITKEAGDALRTAAASGTVSVQMEFSRDLDRDGTLDNAIIAHEWGHYLSNRLIGNGSGLSSHQARSLGEGWSDFVALLMTVRQEDQTHPANANWSGAYGVAGYTQSGGANQGYYWGIRRVPYSTDLTRNGLMLRHMAFGAAHSGYPVAFGQDGASNSMLHNTGEVWATMLWEAYVSLLRAHPFGEAQERMKHYLVASLKATPLQPTILEARDALIAVAAANDPADMQRFISAFARRGAGHGARVADRASQDHIGVVESFAVGNVLEVLSLTLSDEQAGCDRDGVLDVGETGLLKLTLRNVGITTLFSFQANLSGATVGNGAAVTVSVPDPTFYFPNLAPGASHTASVPVSLAGAEALAQLDFTVSLPFSRGNGQSTYSASIAANYDEVPSTSNQDAFATRYSPWTRAHGGAGKIWSPAQDGVITYMHLDDPDGAMESHLIAPTVVAAAGQNFILQFSHRYSFEAADDQSAFYDGGVLELSIDGGPWTDVFDFQWYSGTTVNAGYRAYLASGSALGGRPAYVGQMPGFPGYTPVTVNFGQQFAGKQVQVRFRAASDVAVGAYGWDIRAVAISGSVGLPFPGRVDETSGGGCNQRPIANAGVGISGLERDGTGALRPFKLSGGASFDPDASGPLTYQWTQRSGPAVVLDDPTAIEPTFVADVATDVVLTFELVVNDTVENSLPSPVQVRVFNSNRAPVAVANVKAPGPTTVEERSGSVTLDGTSSSDVDNEPLNFTWVQTSGPAVQLDDPTSATPTLTPPEVAADTTFTFELVVDDGIDASAPSSVTVTVLNVDRAPVADAGAAQLVLPGSTVQLVGSVIDPDGDAITSITWTQTSGAPVTLDATDALATSFTAPKVSTREVLTFTLGAVANGVASNVASVEVTVAGENAAPILTGATRLSAVAGADVTLTVAGHDPDGDALTYAWTQTGGAQVSLSNGAAGTVSFKAPESAAASELVFEVVASDGLASSAAHRLTVTVSAMDEDEGGGCSATGSGASGALLPGLGLLAALMLRRRRSVG